MRNAAAATNTMNVVRSDESVILVLIRPIRAIVGTQQKSRAPSFIRVKLRKTVSHVRSTASDRWRSSPIVAGARNGWSFRRPVRKTHPQMTNAGSSIVRGETFWWRLIKLTTNPRNVSPKTSRENGSSARYSVAAKRPQLVTISAARYIGKLGGLNDAGSSTGGRAGAAFSGRLPVFSVDIDGI
jgi:hypothetical protein